MSLLLSLKQGDPFLQPDMVQSQWLVTNLIKLIYNYTYMVLKKQLQIQCNTNSIVIYYKLHNYNWTQPLCLE